MKFSNGQWLNKDGYTPNSPAEVRDVRRIDQGLEVFVPCKAVHQRSDTLSVPLITIRITSPLPNLIKVTAYHYRDYEIASPRFGNYEIQHEHFTAEVTGSEAILISGKASVRIPLKGAFALNYYYDGELKTSSAAGSMAYVEAPENKVFFREQLCLDVDECVYGLGERFTHFVKNGQAVEIWNLDGGTNSEQTYKNIPFYITNKCYGILVNHPEKVDFEVASEKVERVQFSVEGEALEYYFIGGTSMKEVLKNYVSLTGKPALPPAWSFGLWLTTSFTTSYDEATVNSFIDGMLNRDIPLSVFHFDCFWMKEYQWCDFEWDPATFPDPKSMLERLKEKGLKICVWINPYIAQKSRMFEEGLKNGYLIKRPNGRVFQRDDWQSGMGLVDFTNPEACYWFSSKLKVLLDMGVDCFKTDFGERIPTDVIYFDGSDPVRMHNYYTHLYNRTVFQLLLKERGEDEACLFARSATVGGQQFPVHWGGDCTATYPSMAESLRGGLSLMMSGFGFWSHDISGFESTATPDIYKRWAAFGLLSTHSRLHGSSSYRVPWLFDEEAVDVVRYFTKLKCRLMPYLYKCAVEATTEGTPMMRPMVLEFTEDPCCDYLDKQYMLGDALLVAPIFNQNSTANYYLPKGNWTHYISGAQQQGGSYKKEKHSYLSLPLMARPNTMIAVGCVDHTTEYDYADDVVIHLFELEEGCSAETIVYSIGGGEELHVTASRSNGIVTVTSTSVGKPWSLLLRNCTSVAAAVGATTQITPEGVLIIPEKAHSPFTITL